jgi:GTPase Era involved in 16S rRNA processing
MLREFAPAASLDKEIYSDTPGWALPTKELALEMKRRIIEAHPDAEVTIYEVPEIVPDDWEENATWTESADGLTLVPMTQLTTEAAQ